jgi:hypothetical protein
MLNLVHVANQLDGDSLNGQFVNKLAADTDHRDRNARD